LEVRSQQKERKKGEGAAAPLKVHCTTEFHVSQELWVVPASAEPRG